MEQRMDVNNKIESIVQSAKGIYFIGIGGIGMSALARYFQSRGVQVSGYDRTQTPLTLELEKSGMDIHYEENINAIPKEVSVVVYTPAVPQHHAELVYYKEHGYEVVKRSDVLQWITESSFNICVGGTHGKTTITTMVAHLLRHSGYGCNAFLGGISANYGTNFWSSERNVAVIEADEYDRSFLKLVPDIAIVTAIDADHLDIYGTEEEVGNAFVQFSQRVKKGGYLINKYGIKRDAELKGDKHYRYALDQVAADIHAADIKVTDGSYVFNVVSKEWTIKDMVLHMGGLHNVENSIAAITVAKLLGIDDDKIKAALADFKGVKRRFEYYIREKGRVLIDDYAHHPEELRALITGVHSLYGKEKCTVIFQPHLFSRTRDFATEFAESLDLADEVILLPIYPARELPMEGITSALIADKIKKAKVHMMTKDEMKAWVMKHKPGLTVIAGAGDIDALVGPVKEMLLSSL